MFNLYMAKSLPQIEMTNVAVAAAKAAKDSATHELRITVKKQRSSADGARAGEAREDRAAGPVRAAGSAKGSTTRIAGRSPEFFLNGGETRTLTLRVKAGTKPEDRTFTLRALSTRGGVVEREVKLDP